MSNIKDYQHFRERQKEIEQEYKRIGGNLELCMYRKISTVEEEQSVGTKVVVCTDPRNATLEDIRDSLHYSLAEALDVFTEQARINVGKSE